MRPGDLTAGAAKLQESWKKLRAHWDATTVEWHDAVSQDFEARYLDAIEPQLAATLERMRALAGVLTSAQHECEQ